MNRRISHGQAIRSTLAFSLVTHFMPLAPCLISCAAGSQAGCWLSFVLAHGHRGDPEGGAAAASAATPPPAGGPALPVDVRGSRRAQRHSATSYPALTAPAMTSGAPSATCCTAPATRGPSGRTV